MSLSKIIKLFAGLLIASGGLYFFLKGVDLRTLGSDLTLIHPLSLVAAIFFVILTLYFRAIRWSLILPDVPNTTKKQLFSTVVIGFMMNNIFPARIGELVRAFILWRNNKFPATICIGNLILERIIDLLVILGFFALPILLLPQCVSLRPYGIIAAMIIFASIIGLFCYVQFQPFVIKISSWFVARLPKGLQEKVTVIGKDLASNLGWLSSPKKIVKVVFWSIMTILCYPAIIMLLAWKGTFSIGLLEGMFAQAFAAFGAAIPLAPGYVGTLHAVMLQGLSILGMDTNHARALVIAYHIINYVPITILGLILFFQTKLSFKDITHAKEKIMEQEK